MRSDLRTPLALAVLNLLHERSMHPYEMQQLMRERAHDQVIKLKGGSLYSTIDRLTAGGLIRPLKTSRTGRRPERTVYALTPAGRRALLVWLRELFAQPVPEYPWFGSALAFLAALPPAEAADLLERRVDVLQSGIAANKRALDAAALSDLPRLFVVEGEYALAMRRAELVWVRGIVDDIKRGALTWPPEVLALQQERKTDETDDDGGEGGEPIRPPAH